MTATENNILPFLFNGSTDPNQIAISVEYVQIQEDVTEIPDHTFEMCRALTRVEIPNSVTIIGDNAFFRCVSLQSIDLPSSLTQIGGESFAGSGLAEIDIPETVTRIGNAAFESTRSLQRIVFPANPELEIGMGVCMSCTNLTTVEIPSGIKSITMWVFWGCKALANINIPDSVVLIDEAAFGTCHSLTDVVLPKKLREIGNHAFYKCCLLKTIDIPDTVTHIKRKAFAGCQNLATVRLSENAQLNIAPEVFSNCPSLFQVQLPILMPEQVQIALINQINEFNHPSFQYVGLNSTGRRTFLAHVPILLLPHLFVHSPRSQLWFVHNEDDDVYGHQVDFQTKNSTRMSVLFCHLRDNMADMLDMRVKRYSRRRRRQRG
jgi:hypothetical protein